MDGCRVDEKCMGTYIHGILDNASFIEFLLKPYAHRLTEEAETFNYQTYKEQQYDKLADHVRAHVNIPLVYQILTEDYD
jgi:adenosylcobyric acid synthase